ncbi:hypothetical protein LTR08_008354 [Meristemomyces frigidus]|nr:hypothetical protein LTR08_008354 [Meristemomyces frigidus]
MDDYERSNAREWDPDYKDPETRHAAQDGWQVVGGEKKREAVQPKSVVKQPQQIGNPRQQAARPQQKYASKPARPSKSLPPKSGHGQPARQQSRGGPLGKWQTSGALKSHQVKRGPPRLLQDSDNEGKVAWRSHHPPRDDVRIPKDLALNVEQYNYHHEQIAEQHGVFMSSHARPDLRHMTFDLYGDPKAVESTKQAILSWVGHVSGDRKFDRGPKFAKIQSLTEPLQAIAEKKWKREVTRQTFRQHPPPTMAFQAIGAFHWPIQEYRPEEILGGAYEALDPVRMSNKCYIVYEKERNMFLIMGKASNVQEGLRRLRKTCFQIAARHVTPERKYLLRWAKGANIPTTVYFEEYHRPAVVSTGDAVAEKPGKSPMGNGQHHNEKRIEGAEMQTNLNKVRLLSMLFKAIRKLHYYRGSLQMRIRLGTFLASRYKEPPADGLYDLKEFEGMIALSQFEAVVTQEIGHKPTEEALLSELQARKDLVTPVGATTESLADEQPVYTAVYTFADETGDLRLSVSWRTEEGSTSFDRISKKWTRLERDVGTPTPIFDVSLADLNSGAAWQFDILASQAVDESRLPPLLKKFASSVEILPAEAKHRSPERVFVRHTPHASLRSVQQSISYRCTIKQSDFTLELNHFKNRVRPSRSPSGGTPADHEARWSLSVYRAEWDTMLARNESLPIGEIADWEDDVRTWFPFDLGMGIDTPDEDEGGWTQFLEKLERVETLVQAVRGAVEDSDPDLMGGMATS